MQAVLEGRVKKARIMLEASDGKLDGARDDGGHTLLIASCFIKNSSSRLRMVEMLLDRNLQINRRDLKGRTALSHASEHGYCDVVTQIVRHRNVDPDAVDFKGNTPLIHAAQSDQTEVVKILTQNFRRLGLRVDHINDDGFTALQIAARRGFLECCRVLVHHGRASRNLRDRENNLLPIEWMLKHKFESATIEFLRPKSRFYRVAKLATSLAKARSMSAFDRGVMVRPAQSQCTVPAVKRADAAESKQRPTGTHRIQPKRQKSEEGPTVPRRRGNGHKAGSIKPFTPLLHSRTMDIAEPQSGQRKSSVKTDHEPVPKPRRRRSNKSRRVSAISQTSVDKEQSKETLSTGSKTSQKSKTRRMKRVPADAARTPENAWNKESSKDTAGEKSVLELSWDSVSSVLTTMETLSSSEADLTRSEESSEEL